MLAHKVTDLANLQALLLPYAHNGHRGMIITDVSDLFGEHSPIDSVSNIMKLCDYDADKKSNSFGYSLILK